jgi:DNA-binding transcriptional LysR family regulator
MRELQWDDLRVLLALIRAANLHEAAAQLAVDRSTISRRITALEESLGATLFTRTREGMRPTATAQRLRAHAETLESNVTALRNAAAVGDQQPAGIARIATTEAMAADMVEQGLLGVIDQYPDVAIEIVAGNKPVDIARGEADIAVRLSSIRQASLRVRCLARVGIGLFASPDYLQSRGISRSRALDGHDILLPTGDLGKLPESRWLASRQNVRIALRSNSMPALVAAAIAGRGIVAMGLGWGDRLPGLQRILVLDHIPTRAIWLVTRENDSKRPLIRLVADRIAAIFARAQHGSAS